MTVPETTFNCFVVTGNASWIDEVRGIAVAGRVVSSTTVVDQCRNSRETHIATLCNTKINKK